MISFSARLYVLGRRWGSPGHQLASAESPVVDPPQRARAEEKRNRGASSSLKTPPLVPGPRLHRSTLLVSIAGFPAPGQNKPSPACSFDDPRAVVICANPRRIRCSALGTAAVGSPQSTVTGACAGVLASPGHPAQPAVLVGDAGRSCWADVLTPSPDEA